MYQPYLEEITRYAAEGELAPELQRAKAEFTQRTGEMFETDVSFERRIAAFLEWYVLDRKISTQPELTPAELFLLQRGAALQDVDRNRYAALSHSVLSLYEFRRARSDHLVLRDLLGGHKVEVYERRRTAGLEAGDILEARVVPYEGLVLLGDAYYCHPRDARGEIVTAAKRYRKAGPDEGLRRIELVHRVAYFANRAERYKHLKAKQVFKELNAKAA